MMTPRAERRQAVPETTAYSEAAGLPGDDPDDSTELRIGAVFLCVSAAWLALLGLFAFRLLSGAI